MKVYGRDLVKKIREADLPGDDAHAVYSPPYRPVFSYEQILKRNPKFAAVNIMLYLKDNRWYFPLIVRSTNDNDRHSGQISLPGGKKEDTDTDFAATARRETSEEVGIEEYYIRIIRELSPIYIPPSNFYVRPFVSFTRKNPEFTLQEREAAELIEVPVESIQAIAETPVMMVMPTSNGVEVPVIDFRGYHIWGATSMIISEFQHLLKKL